MSAFSTSQLTSTNAPSSSTSGNFGASSSTSADTLLLQLSSLKEQVDTLSSNLTDLIASVASLQTSKQDVLTFDTTPTENSTNPVTSGGVYTAINSLETELAIGTMVRIPYGATVPTNWLYCDGSTFSSATYSELYEILGTDSLPTEDGAIIKAL